MEKIASPRIAKNLLAALDDIDRPDTFAVSGHLPAILPGLRVRDVGPLSFPLTAEQARSLAERCEPAPFGQGEKTLLDPSVRRVKRLKPDRFSIANPEWPALLQQMLDQIQGELGLEGQTLEAELYELLLYEPGGFFVAHRDSEKAERMVATLVVTLPSAYEGGELLVRFEGKEQTFDFAHASPFHIHYAAFYADCEHEVKPLKSGHRLSLVYNLKLAKAGKQLGAPRHGEAVGNLVHLLKGWPTADAAPTKLVFPLSHQYTQEGLDWDALKSVDRARAAALAEAAGQAGCSAFLALLTFWESGGAEGDYRGYGRRRHYDDDDDSGGTHEMIEVFESSLSLDDWRSPAGGRPAFGEITVEHEEIVPPEALTEVDPEEDYHGYTGNAGATLDRWYRHAAVVIWPRRNLLGVLSRGGRQAAPAALAEMIASWRASRGNEADVGKAECVALADRIIAGWEAQTFGPRPRAEAGGEDPADVLPSLLALDEPRLIAAYIQNVVARDAGIDPGERLAKAVSQYGWNTFRPELLALFTATEAYTVGRNVRLLTSLCRAASAKGLKPKARREANEINRLMGESAIEALECVDRANSPPHADELCAQDRLPILVDLLRALATAGFDDLAERALDHLRGLPDLYPLREVQLPALQTLAASVPGDTGLRWPPLRRWVEACRASLQALTASAPKPPADLRRDADIACSCHDCTELKRFLADRSAAVYRLKAAQGRRGHVEAGIHNAHVDVETTTETRGSPHVLVCTKNTASFDRQLAVYHEDLKRLAALPAGGAKEARRR